MIIYNTKHYFYTGLRNKITQPIIFHLLQDNFDAKSKIFRPLFQLQISL